MNLLSALVLPVALPMVAKADVRSAGRQRTRLSPAGEKAPPKQKVVQMPAVSATEARLTEAGKLKLGIVILP